MCEWIDENEDSELFTINSKLMNITVFKSKKGWKWEIYLGREYEKSFLNGVAKDCETAKNAAIEAAKKLLITALKMVE